VTYSRFETDRVTCDDCGDTEETTISVEHENVMESEESWILSLKRDGWTYNKEDETHKCPECVKREGN